MNKPNPNYQAMYLCDNILNHDGGIGLLHLDFPRCFIQFKYDIESCFSDYYFWKEKLASINWLDPQYNYTEIGNKVSDSKYLLMDVTSREYMHFNYIHLLKTFDFKKEVLVYIGY